MCMARMVWLSGNGTAALEEIGVSSSRAFRKLQSWLADDES